MTLQTNTLPSTHRAQSETSRLCRNYEQSQRHDFISLTGAIPNSWHWYLTCDLHHLEVAALSRVAVWWTSPWELGQGIWGSTLLPLVHHVRHRAAWWWCDQRNNSSIRQQKLAILPLFYSWKKFLLTCTKRRSSSPVAITQNWKQPECPSVVEQISQLWYPPPTQWNVQ